MNTQSDPKHMPIDAVFEVEDGVISMAYVIDPQINPALNCVMMVRLEEGKVVEHVLVYGFSPNAIAKTAEAKFLEACRTHIWNFDEYTSEDIDVILENGYECYGKNAICITWPIRHKSFEELAEAKRTTMESVQRGLEQSNRGETQSLGSFAKYAAEFVEEFKEEISSEALQIFHFSAENENDKQEIFHFSAENGNNEQVNGVE